MRPKICTVVSGNNLKEFLHNLEKVQCVSQMIELRVDHIKGLRIQDIKTIRSKIKKESIFTCRRSDEGGQFKGTEKERVEIINEALKLGFEHVDIELSTLEKDIINLPKMSRSRQIISYHNFQETPCESFLNSLIKRMKEFNHDIIKIATQVNNDSDILNLCKLILNKKMDEKRIIIGMGEKGKGIRVVGPLLGSYLTYASIDTKNAMLGQLSLSELQSIYKSII